MNWVGVGALAVVGLSLLVAREMKRHANGEARTIVAPAFIAGGIAGIALAVAWGIAVAGTSLLLYYSFGMVKA